MVEDGLDPSGPSLFQLGHHISLANDKAMRASDLIIANQTPLRGISADIGTAVELGYCALGSLETSGAIETWRLLRGRRRVHSTAKWSAPEPLLPDPCVAWIERLSFCFRDPSSRQSVTRLGRHGASNRSTFRSRPSGDRNQGSTMQERTLQQASFVVLLALSSVAFIWLVLPFYSAILWAVVLAVLFHPFHNAVSLRLRPHRNIAAGISVLACVFVVLVPAAFVFAAVVREITSLYEWLSSHHINLASLEERIRAVSPPFLIEVFDNIKLASVDELQERFNSILGQITQWAAPQALGIGQGAAQLIVAGGVMLYLLFFLFRDGAGLSVAIRKASPLADQQTDRFLRKFSDVITATVKGSVVIAIIQGMIGGIVFWLLGLNGALLWGVVMALFSLLPVVGAAVVWVPASGYLLLSGEVAKGVALIAAGVLVIGLIDNLLRPPLVGKGARMPDYVVLISTLGGITLVGVNGFIVGPLIAALFITVWSMASERSSWQ